MSNRSLPTVDVPGRTADTARPAAVQPDWERELAAALVDIARRPGRHAAQLAGDASVVTSSKGVNGDGDNSTLLPQTGTAADGAAGPDGDLHDAADPEPANQGPRPPTPVA